MIPVFVWLPLFLTFDFFLSSVLQLFCQDFISAAVIHLIPLSLDSSYCCHFVLSLLPLYRFFSDLHHNFRRQYLERETFSLLIKVGVKQPKAHSIARIFDNEVNCLNTVMFCFPN